jgi:hypothetical protein
VPQCRTFLFGTIKRAGSSYQSVKSDEDGQIIWEESYQIVNCLHPIIIQKEMRRVSKCEHCDIDAYYKLDAEYFCSEHITMYLCIKCVRTESKKMIDDYPAIRSMKVEPIIHPTILPLAK